MRKRMEADAAPVGKKIERLNIIFDPAAPPEPETILRYRENLNLTQASMASFFGLSLSQYRNIERGRAPAPALMSRVFRWWSIGWTPPEMVMVKVKKGL